MKKILSFLVLIFIFQTNKTLGQKTFFLGARMDLNVYQTRLTEFVQIGIPWGAGFGFSVGYAPKEKFWEIEMDADLSLSGFNGKTTPYSNCFLCSPYNPTETAGRSRLLTADFNYSFLYSLGKKNRLKLGVGFWNNFDITPEIFVGSGGNAYVNTNNVGKYDPRWLYNNKNNYGFLLEGKYKITLELWLNLRYKNGFVNLYDEPNSILEWRQNCLSIGLESFF